MLEVLLVFSIILLLLFIVQSKRLSHIENQVLLGRFNNITCSNIKLEEEGNDSTTWISPGEISMTNKGLAVEIKATEKGGYMMVRSHDTDITPKGLYQHVEIGYDDDTSGIKVNDNLTLGCDDNGNPQIALHNYWLDWYFPPDHKYDEYHDEDIIIGYQEEKIGDKTILRPHITLDSELKLQIIGGSIAVEPVGKYESGGIYITRKQAPHDRVSKMNADGFFIHHKEQETGAAMGISVDEKKGQGGIVIVYGSNKSKSELYIDANNNGTLTNYDEKGEPLQ